MQLQCPQCGSAIEARDVNIDTDLARCDTCDEIMHASDLVERFDLEEALEPPRGTKIMVQRRGDDVAFVIPALGLSGTSIPFIAFATVWISFVAFWTWGASQGSIFFALFSIPFWLAGFAMWGGIITSITQRQRLELRTDAVRVLKRSALGTREAVMPLSEIDEVRMEPLADKDGFGSLTQGVRGGASSQQGDAPTLVFKHGTTTTAVGEHLKPAEKEWIATAAKAYLQQHRHQPPSTRSFTRHGVAST